MFYTVQSQLGVHNLFFVSFTAGVPSLIFSNGRDLLIGDIHGNNLRTLVNSQNRGVAVGVDFHYNLHRIFWTDTIQNKVFYCARISQSGPVSRLEEIPEFDCS